MEFHVTITGKGYNGSRYTVHRVFGTHAEGARYIAQYVFQNSTVENVKFRAA